MSDSKGYTRIFSIEYVDINFQDNDEKCDDFGFSFEKTGILVHKMIKEVPSISVLKLCKVSLKVNFSLE